MYSALASQSRSFPRSKGRVTAGRCRSGGRGCQCLGKGRNRPLDSSSWTAPTPGNAEDGEDAKNERGKGADLYTRDPGRGWRSAGGEGERHAQKQATHPPPCPPEGPPLLHTLDQCREGGGGGKEGPGACPGPGGAESPLEAVSDGKQQLALLEGLHLLEGLIVQGQEAAARVYSSRRSLEGSNSPTSASFSGATMSNSAMGVVSATVLRSTRWCSKARDMLFSFWKVPRIFL